jgi:RNA polymerase sigma-70 factor (ECF subfamily)
LDEGFESLVAEHSRQVLNVALRILGSADAAQDVHQEVFLAIWRRWGSFNGRINWRSYLYRTTVRKAIETAVHRRKVQGLASPAAEPVSRQDGPDGALRAAELQQALAVALAQLPDRQAEVFVLARHEGLGYDEIAAMLGCTQETVRVHLHRALKRLAEELKEHL